MASLKQKMDSLEKGFSSPKTSFSGETKENDVNHDQQIGSDFKSQNPFKPVTKHFMSPTISAISKVTVPRKKILAEKNESLTSYDNSHLQKSPILESRRGLLYSACNCISEADDDELNTCSADASLNPYDPLTNYLSPRPKYLCYKPNRRREILKRRGILNSQNHKFVDDKISSEHDQEESSTPPQEGSSQIMMVRAEDNHNDGQDANDEEEEDESEEVEAAKSWSLKGLVKFLLLLIVIGLSTSYISSMNSPRPLPVVQAIGDLTKNYHRIQVYLFEAIYINVQSGPWKNRSEVQPGDGLTGFLGFNLNGDHKFRRLKTDIDNEEDWEENIDEIVEMPEPPNGEFEDIGEDDETDEDLYWPDWQSAENKDINGEVKDIYEVSDQLPVCESAQTDPATDQELNKVKEGSEGLQQCASSERSECFHGRMDDTQSASGNEPANLNYKGDQLENIYKPDRFERSIGDKGGEEMAGTRLERAEDFTTIGEGERYHKVEDLGGISLEKAGEEPDETKLQISEATASSIEDEIFLPAKMENDDDTQPDASRFEIDVKSTKYLKYMDLGPVAIATILFSMLSIVLASLIYIYPPGAIPAPLHDSQLEVSDRKEKLIQAQAFARAYGRERAESTVKPSSLSCSFEEATKDLKYIHAPDVELLGEFVIGEFSSPLRICERKGRTIETPLRICERKGRTIETPLRICERKGRTIETEESINPISHVVSQAQTLNVSSTGSPSYGSFTAENIIFKKEGARDGNVKVVTTPVRRSSRIRNLSVTSPSKY